MEQGLNNFYRAAVFVILYLLINCFNSVLQINSSNRINEDDVSEISITVLDNSSPEINIFDAEEETEDQEKIVCRFIPERIEFINDVISVELRAIIRLTVQQAYLLITHIDLPPPALVQSSYNSL